MRPILGRRIFLVVFLSRLVSSDMYAHHYSGYICSRHVDDYIDHSLRQHLSFRVSRVAAYTCRLPTPSERYYSLLVINQALDD